MKKLLSLGILKEFCTEPSATQFPKIKNIKAIFIDTMCLWETSIL
jgi:hypothetical protein